MANARRTAHPLLNSGLGLSGARHPSANHQRKNSKAKVSLQIYMRLLGFENAPAKALMKAMAEGALDSGAQERIETAVAYPPWDIVEGPRNRVDEPEEDFDEYSAGCPLPSKTATRNCGRFSMDSRSLIGLAKAWKE
jgi:hypothetical protein